MILNNTLEIMLVEDNPADVRLFKEVLQELDAKINLKVFYNGEDALNYLKTFGYNNLYEVPDLIVLDLNLPKIDGREVIHRTKMDPYLKRIPIIVLTTSTAEKDIETVYNYYANCYIKKLVDFDVFCDLISKTIYFWTNIVVLPIKNR